MSRKAWIWVAGAVAGIVLTALITWAASRLTSQHIGLSSEPLSAGRQLAPRQSESRTVGGEGTRSSRITSTTSITATTTSTTGTREHQGPDD